ncbi:hypothetical protein CFOL_v3_02169 [Cephalotus follicularis]|uniref:Methyltransferase-related protein n=1 Tax=Cephalotus follicularis TaxID=3775 RepID=A0A1Q3ASA3_CEPFO|nr:hypothetical protein CFOL_v3_02169 [Cephalotus follicularis]
MCPLRLILIFLSATLAGFFLIRNLKSQPQVLLANADDASDNDPINLPNNRFSKARSAIESGFWSCMDMASGRYLWRHLVSKRSS